MHFGQPISWHSSKRCYWKATRHKKVKFSIKDFYSKCDQIRKKLRIWSHLL